MKERRIRIVAKERRAWDVGKYVLAVMGVSDNEANQTTLQLDDQPSPAADATSAAKKRAARLTVIPKDRRAEVEPWAERPADNSLEQLSLLPDDADIDQEVA